MEKTVADKEKVFAEQSKEMRDRVHEYTRILNTPIKERSKDEHMKAAGLPEACMPYAVFVSQEPMDHYLGKGFGAVASIYGSCSMLLSAGSSPEDLAGLVRAMAEQFLRDLETGFRAGKVPNEARALIAAKLVLGFRMMPEEMAQILAETYGRDYSTLEYLDPTQKALEEGKSQGKILDFTQRPAAPSVDDLMMRKALKDFQALDTSKKGN